MKRLLADSCGTADEKAEPKKDGDVEMKGDEVPSGKPVDESPSTKTPEDTKPTHQEKHYNSLCYKKILKTLRYICITTEAQIVIG